MPTLKSLTSSANLSLWANPYLPNILTGARFVAAPVVFYCILSSHTNIAFILTLLGAITDWADGYIARKFNTGSSLGCVLDPLADKALIIGATAALFYINHLPIWLFIPIVMRDILILSGAILWILREKKTDMHVVFISKINTTLQLILILYLLSTQHVQGIFYWACAYGTLMTTLLSGISYARIFIENCRK